MKMNLRNKNNNCRCSGRIARRVGRRGTIDGRGRRASEYGRRMVGKGTVDRWGYGCMLAGLVVLEEWQVSTVDWIARIILW